MDHPNTLQVKQRRLAELLGSKLQHVHFLAIDFNEQRLEDVLPDVLDRAAPTFFIWEGVTNYLSATAVAATFRSLRTVVDDSTVVFTYIDRDVLRPISSHDSHASVQKRLRSVGEEWTFGFDPPELDGYLKELGFQLLEDLDSRTYREKYWGSEPSLLRGYEFYHVALARASETA